MLINETSPQVNQITTFKDSVQLYSHQLAAVNGMKEIEMFENGQYIFIVGYLYFPSGSGKTRIIIEYLSHAPDLTKRKLYMQSLLNSSRINTPTQILPEQIYFTNSSEILRCSLIIIPDSAIDHWTNEFDNSNCEYNIFRDCFSIQQFFETISKEEMILKPNLLPRKFYKFFVHQFSNKKFKWIERVFVDDYDSISICSNIFMPSIFCWFISSCYNVNKNRHVTPEQDTFNLIYMDNTLKESLNFQPHVAKMNPYNDIKIEYEDFYSLKSTINRKAYIWQIFYKNILDIIQCKCLNGLCENNCENLMRHLERIMENVMLECCICLEDSRMCLDPSSINSNLVKLESLLSYYKHKIYMADFFDVFEEEILKSETRVEMAKRAIEMFSANSFVDYQDVIDIGCGGVSELFKLTQKFNCSLNQMISLMLKMGNNKISQLKILPHLERVFSYDPVHLIKDNCILNCCGQTICLACAHGQLNNFSHNCAFCRAENGLLSSMDYFHLSKAKIVAVHISQNIDKKFIIFDYSDKSKGRCKNLIKYLDMFDIRFAVLKNKNPNNILKDFGNAFTVLIIQSKHDCCGMFFDFVDEIIILNQCCQQVYEHMVGRAAGINRTNLKELVVNIFNEGL
jgi:hypothetical protein